MERPSMRRFVFCNEENKPDLAEEETLDYELDGVSLYFEANESLGLGKLYITNRRVLWVSELQSYDFDVPYITLHAVSRDLSSFPLPCIYCQLDVEIDDEDEEVHSEAYFVPKDESTLMELFQAFSNAAMLNPDPIEQGEEEGDDELIYNMDEVALGAEQARMLDHLESVFQLPNEIQASYMTTEQQVNDSNSNSLDFNGNSSSSQYEDAEEEEDEEENAMINKEE